MQSSGSSEAQCFPDIGDPSTSSCLTSKLEMILGSPIFAINLNRFQKWSEIIFQWIILRLTEIISRRAARNILLVENITNRLNLRGRVIFFFLILSRY